MEEGSISGGGLHHWVLLLKGGVKGEMKRKPLKYTSPDLRHTSFPSSQFCGSPVAPFLAAFVSF